jgi:hypothetical protein
MSPPSVQSVIGVVVARGYLEHHVAALQAMLA